MLLKMYFIEKHKNFIWYFYIHITRIIEKELKLYSMCFIAGGLRNRWVTLL